MMFLCQITIRMLDESKFSDKCYLLYLANCLEPGAVHLPCFRTVRRSDSVKKKSFLQISCTVR